jgi:hypothetical protein
MGQESEHHAFVADQCSLNPEPDPDHQGLFDNPDTEPEPGF